jgi:hypothetical protein
VGQGRRPHAAAVFVVTEEDEAAIRAVYEQRGEFAAAVEFRRLFPGITQAEHEAQMQLIRGQIKANEELTRQLRNTPNAPSYPSSSSPVPCIAQNLGDFTAVTFNHRCA